MLQSRWTDLVKETQKNYQFKEITAEELAAQLTEKEKPVIIDVREGAEWAQTGKIPNAVTLSRGVLELAIEKVVSPDSDRPVVLYCAGGLRSIMAAEAMARMGYDKKNLISLKGGFSAWNKAGQDVEK
ncbi:rhodanese domain-containing protein [Syncephalastrum racemosum]|uniref:Rhodanese domain-containing protein n=1 Tax=Syncephalastrum racemosum TaxID=13706 RepID=A0A1X2HH17_SYNRA|nr:rhodanese domain-containing protein [Syncephalastrum racemosum]